MGGHLAFPLAQADKISPRSWHVLPGTWEWGVYCTGCDVIPGFPSGYSVEHQRIKNSKMYKIWTLTILSSEGFRIESGQGVAMGMWVLL